MVPASPCDAARMPTAVTSLSAIVRVSMRLGRAGDPQIHHALAGLDEIERECGQFGGVRGVDDRVPRQRGQLGPLPDPGEAKRARELEARRRSAHEMHLHAVGARELGGEQSHRAGAEHQHAITGVTARRPAPHEARCRRARPSRRRCRRRCRATPAAPRRDRELLGERARQRRRGCRSRRGPRRRCDALTGSDRSGRTRSSCRR